MRTPRYDAARAALAEAYAELCAESLRDSAAMDDAAHLRRDPVGAPRCAQQCADGAGQA